MDRRVRGAIVDRRHQRLPQLPVVLPELLRLQAPRDRAPPERVLWGPQMLRCYGW